MIKNITLKENKLLVDIIQEMLEEEKQNKFILLPEVLFKAGFCDRKGQARRLILQGGVKLWYNKKSEKLEDIELKLFEGEYLLSVGKRKFKKVKIICNKE
jgi:tyrosyl-tRNA synthetase